jgi:cytochrome P450
VGRQSELVPAVVEETVRWEGPIQVLFRRVRREVTLGGTTLPENAIVMPLLGSANRDESQVPQPDVFDITRDTSGHLGFGLGVHYCLGAAPARLEARVAIDAFLDHLPRLTRSDPTRDYVDSFLIRGPHRLGLTRAP